MPPMESMVLRVELEKGDDSLVIKSMACQNIGDA